MRSTTEESLHILLNVHALAPNTAVCRECKLARCFTLKVVYSHRKNLCKSTSSTARVFIVVLLEVASE